MSDLAAQNTEKLSSKLAIGDWEMATVRIFSAPLIPLLLAAYNFFKNRRPQIKLYSSAAAVSCLSLQLG